MKHFTDDETGEKYQIDVGLSDVYGTEGTWVIKPVVRAEKQIYWRVHMYPIEPSGDGSSTRDYENPPGHISAGREKIWHDARKALRDGV